MAYIEINPIRTLPASMLESIIAFLTFILILKFITDLKVDEYRRISNQFTEYQNQIKRGVLGYGEKGIYN